LIGCNKEDEINVHSVASSPDQTYLHTSESVSAGHPDKVCDQISDAILDACLTQNPYAHCAIETMATTNRVIVAGELRGASLSSEQLDFLVRKIVKQIGYDQAGFSYRNLEIDNYLHEQSEDIARAVGEATAHDEGAGDQGLMFGYACDETEAFMPAPIYYSHLILRNLNHARLTKYKDFLGPDAKSQVTVEYDGRSPFRTKAVVLSTQHSSDVTSDELFEMVFPIIEDSLPEQWVDQLDEVYINPSGRFVIGGPDGDTGLTGRKIIVDTYGGAAPHGGGAFSGKDPTKVDRSGAYMMRYLAKNIVASGACERCTIQVSYVIGKSDPLSLYINTHNTGKVPSDALHKAVLDHFDLRPKGIRQFLGLNKPIYQRTASYGHFGREPDADGGFSWEELNSVELFQNLL